MQDNIRVEHSCEYSLVRDDLELLGDTGYMPYSECSGSRFDSLYEIFS